MQRVFVRLVELNILNAVTILAVAPTVQSVTSNEELTLKFLITNDQTEWRLSILLLVISLLAWSFVSVATADGTAIEIQIVSDVVPIDSPELIESERLARRLLTEQSADLVFDRDEVHTLAAQISEVLNTVRHFDPALAPITATPRMQPDRLILKFENELQNAVSNRLNQRSGSVAFNTGFKDFDILNQNLGLYAVRHFSHIDTHIFYYNKPVNLLAAIDAYSNIVGVDYAEPDEYLYVVEPSDVSVYQVDQTWYLIFKSSKAQAFETQDDIDISMFSVRDGQVTRYESQADCQTLPATIPCLEFGQ